MKILLVNPNLTQSITDRVLGSAQAAARPGTDFKAVTGRFGPQVIGSRAEDALAAHGVLDLVAEHAGECDAVVLAVSLDTAAWACRELLDIPVVGMTEAALHTAALIAPRFAVLTLGQRMVPLYRELVDRCGLLSRVSGVAALDLAPQAAVADDGAAVAARVAECVNGLVEDGAEAVVLSGAALAGLVPAVQPLVRVPVLDGITCAVGLAETLVHQRWPRPQVGSVSGTGGRRVQGVSFALEGLFARG